MSSNGGDGGFTPPWWFGTAARFFGLGAAATAGGVTLFDNPVQFVFNVVFTRVVDGILSLFAQIGGLIVLVGRQIRGALRDAGGSVADELGVLALPAEVLLETLDSTVSTAVGAAGPAAPLVYVASWVGALLAGALLVRGTIEVIRLIP